MQLEQFPESSVERAPSSADVWKPGKELAEMTPRQREFQTCAIATGKARSPTVDSRDVGTTRKCDDDNRSRCLDGRYVYRSAITNNISWFAVYRKQSKGVPKTYLWCTEIAPQNFRCTKLDLGCTELVMYRCGIPRCTKMDRYRIGPTPLLICCLVVLYQNESNSCMLLLHTGPKFWEINTDLQDRRVARTVAANSVNLSYKHHAYLIFIS